MPKTCCWIIEAASKGKPGVYCGKPTRYKMAKDDDENARREYHSLCPEHQAVVESRKDDWEYDDV